MSHYFPHHAIPDERKARLLEIAEKDKDLNLDQLVARIGMSKETVRRLLGPEECKRRRVVRGDIW